MIKFIKPTPTPVPTTPVPVPVPTPTPTKAAIKFITPGATPGGIVPNAESWNKEQGLETQPQSASPSPSPSPSPKRITFNIGRKAPEQPIAQPIAQPIEGELVDAPENPTTTSPSINATFSVIDNQGREKEITLNEKQLEAVQLGIAGTSFCLIGAAGSGKTTTTLLIAQSRIRAGLPIVMDKHDYLPNNVPGIIGVSYTRRSVANLARALEPIGMGKQCVTVHKALEYAPMFYDVYDPKTRKERKTMRFEPRRGVTKPLSDNIKVVILDESGNISEDLYSELEAALSSGVQCIFIGDLNQLPPTFGHAILGFKLLELPRVELTEIYRQALESPIIRLAHRVLSGRVLNAAEITRDWQFPGQLQFNLFKNKTSDKRALAGVAKILCNAIDNGKLDIETDIILCPFNKGFGTLELNRHIANHIARREGKLTHEIIAGFRRMYFSIGDKVLYDREDAIILDIQPNESYLGVSYRQPSLTLDYWGHDKLDNSAHLNIHHSNAEMDIDALIAAAGSVEDRTLKCSHVIKLRMLNSDAVLNISEMSQISNLIHAYAITVHKAQGSEWDRVFLCIHESHACMLSRELLYTAVTRAAKQLVVLCEQDSFVRGISSQVIKGATLDEKAAYFNGKAQAREGKKTFGSKNGSKSH